MVGHRDRHQPPPACHQLRHQHPRLLLPQLTVQAGVQKGLQESLRENSHCVGDRQPSLRDKGAIYQAIIPKATAQNHNLPKS